MFGQIIQSSCRLNLTEDFVHVQFAISAKNLKRQRSAKFWAHLVVMLINYQNLWKPVPDWCWAKLRSQNHVQTFKVPSSFSFEFLFGSSTLPETKSHQQIAWKFPSSPTCGNPICMNCVEQSCLPSRVPHACRFLFASHSTAKQKLKSTERLGGAGIFVFLGGRAAFCAPRRLSNLYGRLRFYSAARCSPPRIKRWGPSAPCKHSA